MSFEIESLETLVTVVAGVFVWTVVAVAAEELVLVVVVFVL